MKNVNIEDAASIMPSPADSKSTAKTDLAMDRSESPGWWIRNASELTSCFAVVMVLILSFGVLSGIANRSPIWVTNPNLFVPLAGIFTSALLLFLFFSWQVVRGEQMIIDSEPHVLSAWSLKTLNASGLPSDLGDRLAEILEQVKDQSRPPSTLTVVGRGSPEGSWMADLVQTFGKSRVTEYEEMLFKYTARQSGV